MTLVNVPLKLACGMIHQWLASSAGFRVFGGRLLIRGCTKRPMCKKLVVHLLLQLEIMMMPQRALRWCDQACRQEQKQTQWYPVGCDSTIMV